MIVELAAVLAILLGGCAFVTAAGLTGWAVPAFGYLAGVGLVIGAGFVQLLSPLPNHPALTLGVTVAAPAAWWLVRRRRRPAGPDARWFILIGVGCAAGVVVLARTANLVKFHADSVRYLMASQMFVNDTYFDGARSKLLTKRLIAEAMLHAPARLNDEEYLPAATPLLALATLAVLVWCFQRGVRRWCDPPRIALFAGLGVLLLVTTNRFVFHAFYLNGHLLFAAFFLVVVASGWLLTTRAAVPASALVAMQADALPAMVLTRPEAPLMAVTALLPVLLSGDVAVRYRAALLVALGTTTTAWYATVVVVSALRDEAVPGSAYGLLALGISLLGAVGLLRWRALSGRASLILGLVEAGLWLALAGFAARQPDILTDSLRAELRNLALGSGGWGPSLLLLAGLAVIAGALLRTPGQTTVRFPLTTFLPLAFLFAYLRDEAYRVGYPDSLNRMVIQVVPVLVWGIIVAMAAGSWRFRRTRDRGPAASVGGVPAPAEAGASAEPLPTGSLSDGRTGTR